MCPNGFSIPLYLGTFTFTTLSGLKVEGKVYSTSPVLFPRASLVPQGIIG